MQFQSDTCKNVSRVCRRSVRRQCLRKNDSRKKNHWSSWCSVGCAAFDGLFLQGGHVFTLCSVCSFLCSPAPVWAFWWVGYMSVHVSCLWPSSQAFRFYGLNLISEQSKKSLCPFIITLFLSCMAANLSVAWREGKKEWDRVQKMEWKKENRITLWFWRENKG